MVGVSDIVITGIGCVTPIGIGREQFVQSLLERRCAIRRFITLSDKQRTTYYGAAIDNFDGKLYVTPRKAMKVMGREVQIAYSAAHLAWHDAGLAKAAPDPARIGVSYGSEMIPGDIAELTSGISACVSDGQMQFDQWGGQFAKHVFPLWMLKYLPNMPACHVGIAVDARGPNNSIALEEASSLLALGEAAGIIQRGDADLMVVGAIGSRVTPTRMMYRAPGLYHQHAFDGADVDQSLESGFGKCVPFDIARRGIVSGEGSAALIVERRAHALARGAKILASIRGFSSRCGRPLHRYGGSSTAIASAAADAIRQAGIQIGQLSHTCAQGFSEKQLDAAEAAALYQVAPDVPVVAFSSYFGTCGAAGGLLELAASIGTFQAGKTMPTLGVRQVDTDCPIHLVTESDADAESAVSALKLPRLDEARSHILKISFTPHGQAAAMVVQCET